jgi:hypothetical protein
MNSSPEYAGFAPVKWWAMAVAKPSKEPKSSATTLGDSPIRRAWAAV